MSRTIDYTYIAEHISNLTRIMVRVYKDGDLISFHDPFGFPTDPASPYMDNFFQIKKEVCYYITPYDQFYGILHYDAYCLVIGPTFEMSPSRPRIREFMFELDIRQNYYEQYLTLFLGITPMPLRLFLHELCLIYYFISEKKHSLTDLASYEAVTSRPTTPPTSSDISPFPPAREYDFFSEHSTIDFEKDMLRLITVGDLDGLNSLFSMRSAGRAGKLADNHLRQTKNIFISTATLVSRAAMDGGLPAEEALSLSDRYIRHCENLSRSEQVMNLQSHMVMDFATLVAELKVGKRHDKFLRGVIGYIREHLTDNLNVEQMANDLGMNRSYLSAKFKKESGTTLTSYIQEQKLKKAMEYLEKTEKSILEISTLLGFSSQGYFQNVFKKHTGMTPKDYREQ